jgi:hypothetical protein
MELVMEVLDEQTDQPDAPSANGKSAPFEGEDVGSIPTGASKLAPIHRCKVQRTGLYTFVLVEPDGSLFDVGAEINRQFMEGGCNK